MQLWLNADSKNGADASSNKIKPTIYRKANCLCKRQSPISVSIKSAICRHIVLFKRLSPTSVSKTVCQAWYIIYMYVPVSHWETKNQGKITVENSVNNKPHGFMSELTSNLVQNVYPVPKWIWNRFNSLFLKEMSSVYKYPTVKTPFLNVYLPTTTHCIQGHIFNQGFLNL